MVKRIIAISKYLLPALLLAMVVALGGGFSQAFINIVSSTGLTASTQTIYPGGTATLTSLVGTTHGTAVLSAANYNITSTTMQDIGLSVSLPAAGDYEINANVRTQVACTVAGGFITMELYDSTNSSAIANSETQTSWVATTGSNYSTTPISWFVTTAGAVTLKVYAARGVGGTCSAWFVYHDSDGRSRITYKRLS